MSASMETLSPQVEGIVRRELEGLDFRSLTLSMETDHDGDTYLQVTIVIDGGPLDGPRVLALRRNLAAALRDMGETAFPVTALITTAEQEKLAEAS